MKDKTITIIPETDSVIKYLKPKLQIFMGDRTKDQEFFFQATNGKMSIEQRNGVVINKVEGCEDEVMEQSTIDYILTCHI